MSVTVKPTTHLVRYTAAQYARLTDAAKYREKSLQEFTSDAVMAEVAKAEADMRADEEYQKRKRKRPEATAHSGGLGIRERLEAEAQAREERASQRRTAPADADGEAASPRGGLANIDTPAAESEADSMRKFARYVVEGPRWNRQSRLEEVVRKLGRAADDEDERIRWAKLLDEQITELDNKGKPTSPSIFDTLKTFLAGSDS